MHNVHRDGRAYEDELVSIESRTLALPTLPADADRPISDREIAHPRDVTWEFRSPTSGRFQV